MNIPKQSNLWRNNNSRFSFFPQLLIPHTRYTLQINFLARKTLISEIGVFTQVQNTLSRPWLALLWNIIVFFFLSSVVNWLFPSSQPAVERAWSQSWGDRCPHWPTAPSAYLMTSPSAGWRTCQTSTTEMMDSSSGTSSTGTEGCRVVSCFSCLLKRTTFPSSSLKRFVQGILGHYYKNDGEVQQDSELQKWVSDIFKHGFLSQACTGGCWQKVSNFQEDNDTYWCSHYKNWVK